MDTQFSFFDGIRQAIERTTFAIDVSEEGKVLSVGDGIVKVSGLSDAKLYELVEFEGGDEGIVFDLDASSIGAVLLTEQNRVGAGEVVHKTGRIASVCVGDALLGRVVNALGMPLDGNPAPQGTRPCPVERQAPALIMRGYVSQPLYTGLKVVDSMLPIGRGQRELIIGDPATGKTSIALDTIFSQRDSDVISIYVAIGQKKSRVSKTIEELKRHGDFSKTIVVVADASDTLGLQFIAPYSGTAIGEYFLDKGKDVLIVYDDLTKHAEAYRSLSLLLKRPPGREAYPGDIFFIHSRLLERSAKIEDRFGGGSITALPIVETQQGRISSYIPTNLISITDGQIYLDAQLFTKGIRPAVEVGKSVSRIGGRAQVEAMKLVAERLKIDYSRFIEVEVFTKFGARLEEATMKLIRRGQRVREVLKQPRFHPLTLDEEVITFLILESGVLDSMDVDSVAQASLEILDKTRSAFPDVFQKIRREGRISKDDLERLTGFMAHGE